MKNRFKLICNSFITIVFLLGLCFLLLSLFIVNDTSYQITNDTLYRILSKLLSAIGQTLIGSGVISVLLSFRDVRDFTLGMMKEVLLDCNFIGSFNKEQLEKIHLSCHKVLHYDNVKLDIDNWKDISNKCINSFKEPYCKLWRENIECKIVNNLIIKKFDIHYELHNPLKVSGTADISHRFNLLIPEGKDQEYYLILDSMSIIVDDKIFETKPYIDFAQSELGKYNTIAIIRSNEINLSQFQFKKNLIVNIKLTTKVPLNDLSYTNRLRYPTQHFRLDFVCDNKKSNIKMSITPQFFGGFIKKDGFDILVNDNHAFIDCKDKFLLPGSGACVVLNLEKKNSISLRKKL